MSAERNILVLFAHPALQKSRVNKHLIRAAIDMDGVTFHDLYELYPDFQIDVPAEQNLLRRHDIILLQHPFFWYSSPALLKEWIDLVLQYGFAFGAHGLALKDKCLMQAITMGGGAQAYKHEGMNHFTVRELLAPFEQTTRLCHMRYLAPFVVQGTHSHFGTRDIQPHVDDYRNLLTALRDGKLNLDQLEKVEFANDALPDISAASSTPMD